MRGRLHLALNAKPVNIKQIEYQIAERAFREDWVKPIRPKYKTGKKVAVIGSGPAGLAAAQQVDPRRPRGRALR